MRVFVTGAGGFVGPRLVRALSARGLDVAFADRDVDVTDAASVSEALRRHRPEAVVHLAAESSVARSWVRPQTCFRINVLGTLRLLQAVAREAPLARTLLVGSSEQYPSRRPGEAPLCEDDPLAPNSPYARTKVAAEQIGLAFAAQGLDVVCTRSFTHIGPGQSDEFMASSFARQVSDVRAGRRAPRLEVGNLESVRDVLDVDDVIDAYLELLAPRTAPGVYNVSSGVGVRVGEILTTLCALAGVDPEVVVSPERYRPTDCRVGDPSRLRTATEWKPLRSLRDTLSSMLADWERRLATTG